MRNSTLIALTLPLAAHGQSERAKAMFAKLGDLGICDRCRLRSEVAH
jgi:hypothetical protein